MAELSFLGTQTLKQGFIGGASIVYTKKEYHYMVMKPCCNVVIVN